MAKSNKGIWSYIIRREGTKNWMFKKRYPTSLVAHFGGEFDKFSLKTSDDAEAEVRARDALNQHEARVKAALGDRPFYDLSKKKKLIELTAEERTALEAMLDQCRGRGWIIWRANWNPTKNDLLMFYSDTKSGKHDNEFMAVIRQFDFYMNAGTEIFAHYRDALNEIQRQSVAETVKHLELKQATAIETANLPAFEAKMFETSDKKRPSPMMSVTALWERYKADKLVGSGSKREDEEITRFGNYVRDFAAYVENCPVNYVTRAQVSDFFNDLTKLPSRQNTKERKMTFKELVASNHGRDTITHKAAIEWYARLNRMFSYAESTYRDQFDIKNPFDGMKDSVKGSKGTVKRDWEEDEVAALFAQPEFTDPSKRNSFFYSILCGLTHGNRLSEFHNRKMTELKQDRDGIWYIDVKEAKNGDSVRHVPIADIVIKAGFLEWVEKNKAAGCEYLFPDQDHNDPDSRKFSKDFGKWLVRRKIYNPERTLHNFRDTFLSNAYDTAYPPEITHPPLVARRISGHANRDVHEDYVVIKMPAMKTVVDTVRVRGLPYERFL